MRIMGNLLIGGRGNKMIVISIFSISKSLDAEARSLYLGMLCFMKVGEPSVIVCWDCQDCQDLIDSLHGRRHPYDQCFIGRVIFIYTFFLSIISFNWQWLIFFPCIFRYILDLTNMFYEVIFCYVHREGNETADYIIQLFKKGLPHDKISSSVLNAWVQ